MTDPNFTALQLVMDRSIRMAPIRRALVPVVKSMLAAQADRPGLLRVDLLEFNESPEFRHRLEDPSQVQLAIVPTGRSALRDTIVLGLTDLDRRIEALPEHARPSRVAVIVATHGIDSASRVASPSLTAFAVEHYRRRGWSIAFVGPDDGGVSVASRFGQRPGAVTRFETDSDSMRALGRTIERQFVSPRTPALTSP